MTKDEIKRKLAEVGEWRMPKVAATDLKEGQRRARGRPRAEDRYQEEHEEVFLDLFNGINPTMSPELVKLNIKPKDCEDCGLHLTVSREMEIKFYKAVSNHVAHWRYRCKTCNKYRDPNTGEYTLPQGPACQVFLNWAKAEYNARKKLDTKDSNK